MTEEQLAQVKAFMLTDKYRERAEILTAFMKRREYHLSIDDAERILDPPPEITQQVITAFLIEYMQRSGERKLKLVVSDVAGHA
jgi:hypothetical protein